MTGSGAEPIEYFAGYVLWGIEIAFVSAFLILWFATISKWWKSKRKARK